MTFWLATLTNVIGHGHHIFRSSSQVYGSVVASRYSNQHSLALDKMSVSSECFYQPRVQSDFDADADSLDQQLGKLLTSCLTNLTSLSHSLSLYLPLSLSLSLPLPHTHIDPSNAFQISHADKSFHVFASSTADKANWLANLNKHISRAAQLGNSTLIMALVS